MTKKKKYWIVAREYAGLAEAGGVKSVVTSLARGMKEAKWNVTVIMPLYGCTAIANVDDFDVIENAHTDIIIGSETYRIVYAQGFFKGIRVIFIVHSIFTSKMGVYTYTRLEEALNPKLKSGEGHFDANKLSVLFQKAAIEFGITCNEKPDVFHCQDAHTSLIPFLHSKSDITKRHYESTKFFITIHNAGSVYRDQCTSIKHASTLLGLPEKDFIDYSINGKPEPFLLSQKYATYTTVSPWYANELLDPKNEFCSDISEEFHKRKFIIHGIINGIDTSHYTPTVKSVSKLPFTYNPQKGKLKGKYECRQLFLSKYKTVHTCNEHKKLDRIFQYGILQETYNTEENELPIYFCFHGRLVHQKGIDVLTEAANEVLKKRCNARFIVIGQGTEDLEKRNIELSERHYGKYIFFQGYDQALSRLCIAVSDFFVLPSFFEPCGLQDLTGQIYGTIPVAHASGGLNKIIHEKTGFLYNKNTAEVLASVIISLIDRKISNPKYFLGMIEHSAKYAENEFSWEKIINEKYIPLFL